MRFAIAAICTFLAATACRAERDTAVTPLVVQPPTSLTSTEITAVIGSDEDARAVIAQILASMGYKRSSVVLASQIRREWLPVMKDADFVRLPDTEVRRFLSECGRYWVITDVQRFENVVTVQIDMKCGCSSQYFTASFDGNLWRVSPNGQGCGCGGPPPADCPCFLR